MSTKNIYLLHLYNQYDIKSTGFIRSQINNYFTKLSNLNVYNQCVTVQVQVRSEENATDMWWQWSIKFNIMTRNRILSIHQFLNQIVWNTWVCGFKTFILLLFHSSLTGGFIQCTSTVLPRGPGDTRPYINHKNNMKDLHKKNTNRSHTQGVTPMLLGDDYPSHRHG